MSNPSSFEEIKPIIKGIGILNLLFVNVKLFLQQDPVLKECAAFRSKVNWYL